LLSRRFKNLVIPFLTWYLIFGGALLGELANKGLKVFMLNLIYLPQTGLWFLWALFLCYAMLVFALKLEKRLGLVAFIVTLTLVLGIPAIMNGLMSWQYTNVAGIVFLTAYFPFFLGGYFVARYEERISASRYLNIIALLSLICFPLFLIFSLFLHKGPDPFFVAFFTYGVT
jgi:Acyltransferase family